ncbi:MAG: exonuclease SbcCD subunit D [Acidilobaceae archaeon]|nr:exonuclease SbcCD subunit D [Acidilobaceae archaeon]MCX8165293.1 exonuclease SbcCD subunit D [Acidilobaceae archaeon]MDW7973719.1 exonuclease SbcCD subunit D [Sulfolobales archaeon]
MRFLHVSDTHLGYRHYGLLEREQDFYKAFKEVIDIALEERVDAVLHGGDLFHSSNPSPKAYREAIVQLKRLKEKGIKFFIAPGNHELPKSESKGSPVRVLHEIELLKSPEDYWKPSVFTLGDVSLLVYSSWASGNLFIEDQLRAAGGRVKIALAHLLLCDVTGAPARCESGWWAERIPRGYAYVALGDLHARWERTIGGMKVVYPGATEFSSVSEYLEESNRYAVLGEVRGGEVEVQWVKLKGARPWVYLKGKEEEIVRQLEGLRQREGDPPIVYVEITSGTSVGRRRIEDLLSSLLKGKKVLTYRYEQQPTVQLKVERSWGERLSLEEVVRRLLKEERLVKAMMALLEEPERAKEFLGELERDRALLLRLGKALEAKGR